MRTQRSVDGMSNSSTPCTAFVALMTIAKHVEFLRLKCSILVLILLILLLLLLLLKNYLMPISFTPATNGPLWLFKSTQRRGTNGRIATSATHLLKYSVL